MYSVISTIVVDDEIGALNTAVDMLNKYCPEIKIDGIFDNPEDALVALLELKPGIVFLDYKMPEMNAFQFLKACPNRQWEAVIITGHEWTAATSYDYDIAHFLVKPYSGEKLKEAVERCKKRLNAKAGVDARLLQVPTREQTLFFRYDEIIYLKADGAYSWIYAKNNRSVIIGRGLGKFAEELLKSDTPFFQIHESYIVSRYAIHGISVNSVILTHQNLELPLARRRKQALWKWWNGDDEE